MRIFVSSVRISLEQERDSLKGLILALGHAPVMFEDFTAQPVPSRQACLEGVRSCDVYLLLLGERYGYVFPETGLSPTAEEYVAARTAGIPRLVMRKTGVTPEPKQQELIEQIRSYRDGVFYNEFTDVVDLQAKVAAAIRQAEQAPGPLAFVPLPAGMAVDWRGDWPQPQQGRADRAVLELHVVPVTHQPVPSRVLRDLPDRLASELRTGAGVGRRPPSPPPTTPKPPGPTSSSSTTAGTTSPATARSWAAALRPPDRPAPGAACPATRWAASSTLTTSPTASAGSCGPQERSCPEPRSTSRLQWAWTRSAASRRARSLAWPATGSRWREQEAGSPCRRTKPSPGRHSATAPGTLPVASPRRSSPLFAARAGQAGSDLRQPRFKQERSFPGPRLACSREAVAPSSVVRQSYLILAAERRLVKDLPVLRNCNHRSAAQGHGEGRRSLRFLLTK